MIASSNALGASLLTKKKIIFFFVELSFHNKTFLMHPHTHLHLTHVHTNWMQSQSENE